MTSDSDGGGLSQKEFLLIQEQLLKLRNQNYELQEELKKKKSEILNLQNSPKNEALHFASKLINRSSKKDEKDAEIESLRRKLLTQEEEFKLQQTTFFEEMSRLTSEIHRLKSMVTELEDFKKNASEVKSLTDQLVMSEKLTAELENTMLDYRKRIEETERRAEIAEKALKNQEKIECELKNFKNDNDEISTRNAKISEKLAVFEKNYEDALNKLIELETLTSNLSNSLNKKETDLQNVSTLLDETQKKFDHQSDINKNLEKEISELKKKAETLKKETEKQAEEFRIKSNESKSTIQKLNENSEILRKKEVEDRSLLLETRYQLEIEDLKKEFEAEKEEQNLKIKKLEEKINGHEEEKRLALKKQSALLKEMQKSLRDERKRADSYEKKHEEKSGWHVVQGLDGNSSHTFDGNESVSSLSAIESENVELITRLAALQKLHSENTDKILQLESENSRLRREVIEKGELIENWIKEKPVNTCTSPRASETSGGFRKLLNTLGHDQKSAQELKEMNKKLQRMLEETLSKNIILQRDIQTLLERTEI